MNPRSSPVDPQAVAAGQRDVPPDPSRTPRPVLPPGQGAASKPGERREWVIELPPGRKLLSLNDRIHWAARNRLYQDWKKTAWVMALKAKVPYLGRISVVVEYQPPDARRRDADNPVATAKACIDGMVAARIIPGDESPEHVSSVTCCIGPKYPRGRIVLHIFEEAIAA